jgi:hypothetical protein
VVAGARVGGVDGIRDALRSGLLEPEIDLRLFEALGDIPPAEAESAYYATMTPSESPRMAEQTLH